MIDAFEELSRDREGWTHFHDATCYIDWDQRSVFMSKDCRHLILYGLPMEFWKSHPEEYQKVRVLEEAEWAEERHIAKFRPLADEIGKAVERHRRPGLLG